MGLLSSTGTFTLNCDALPQIQIQHDLSSVLLCVRLHADHLHGLRTREAGEAHRSLRDHRLPSLPDLRPLRAYLVSYVDLGEAEGLQMNAGGPDGRSDGFHQQLLQILADEGPGLLDDLQEKKKSHFCASETAFWGYLQKEITGVTSKTDSYCQSSWLGKKTNKQTNKQIRTFKKLLIGGIRTRLNMQMKCNVMLVCITALLLWDVLTLESSTGVNVGASVQGGSHPCCFQPSAKCSVTGLEQTAWSYSRVASLQYQTC